jgi:hypothetical protein
VEITQISTFICAIVETVGPILHTLPIQKPPTRKVFSFAGIQSTRGVTHIRATGKVHNNIWPDTAPDKGLIIPMACLKTENRPKSQMKTKRHAKKEPEKQDEGFRKVKRMANNQQRWEKLEEQGVVTPKEWLPKGGPRVGKKRGPYKKKATAEDEKPAKRKRKKSSKEKSHKRKRPKK